MSGFFEILKFLGEEHSYILEFVEKCRSLSESIKAKNEFLFNSKCELFPLILRKENLEIYFFQKKRKLEKTKGEFESLNDGAVEQGPTFEGCDETVLTLKKMYEYLINLVRKLSDCKQNMNHAIESEQVSDLYSKLENKEALESLFKEHNEVRKNKQIEFSGAFLNGINSDFTSIKKRFKFRYYGEIIEMQEDALSTQEAEFVSACEEVKECERRVLNANCSELKVLESIFSFAKDKLVNDFSVMIASNADNLVILEQIEAFFPVYEATLSAVYEFIKCISEGEFYWTNVNFFEARYVFLCERLEENEKLIEVNDSTRKEIYDTIARCMSNICLAEEDLKSCRFLFCETFFKLSEMFFSLGYMSKPLIPCIERCGSLLNDGSFYSFYMENIFLEKENVLSNVKLALKDVEDNIGRNLKSFQELDKQLDAFKEKVDNYVLKSDSEKTLNQEEYNGIISVLEEFFRLRFECVTQLEFFWRDYASLLHLLNFLFELEEFGDMERELLYFSNSKLFNALLDNFNEYSDFEERWSFDQEEINDRRKRQASAFREIGQHVHAFKQNFCHPCVLKAVESLTAMRKSLLEFKENGETFTEDDEKIKEHDRQHFEMCRLLTKKNCVMSIIQEIKEHIACIELIISEAERNIKQFKDKHDTMVSEISVVDNELVESRRKLALLKDEKENIERKVKDSNLNEKIRDVGLDEGELESKEYEIVFAIDEVEDHIKTLDKKRLQLMQDIFGCEEVFESERLFVLNESVKLVVSREILMFFKGTLDKKNEEMKIIENCILENKTLVGDFEFLKSHSLPSNTADIYEQMERHYSYVSNLSVEFSNMKKDFHSIYELYVKEIKCVCALHELKEVLRCNEFKLKCNRAHYNYLQDKNEISKIFEENKLVSPVEFMKKYFCEFKELRSSFISYLKKQEKLFRSICIEFFGIIAKMKNDACFENKPFDFEVSHQQPFLMSFVESISSKGPERLMYVEETQLLEELNSVQSAIVSLKLEIENGLTKLKNTLMEIQKKFVYCQNNTCSREEIEELCKKVDSFYKLLCEAFETKCAFYVVFARIGEYELFFTDFHNQLSKFSGNAIVKFRRVSHDFQRKVEKEYSSLSNECNKFEGGLNVCVKDFGHMKEEWRDKFQNFKQVYMNCFNFPPLAKEKENVTKK